MSYEFVMNIGGAIVKVTGKVKPGAAHYNQTGATAALALAALLSIAGCAWSPIPTDVPTVQSIAGLAPSGAVAMTETFVGGAGIGKGVLTFKGKTYPFRLIGTVVGPGSVSKLDVSGNIFKLDDISQFSGPYAQGNACTLLARKPA
jgi:hypothetical protein